MFELIPFERRANRVATYDPFRDLEEFERSVFGGSSVMGSFRTDVIDTGDSYELEAELPGFRKEDIDLDVKDGVLTISAKHQADDRTAADNYICRERRTGSYARSFDVSGIREDGIGASYENGVLKLTLPKQGEQAPVSRKIAIQ